MDFLWPVLDFPHMYTYLVLCFPTANATGQTIRRSGYQMVYKIKTSTLCKISMATKQVKLYSFKTIITVDCIEHKKYRLKYLLANNT